MKKLILSFLVLISISFGAIAQTDTEFWLAAPDLFAGHGEKPIILRLAASDEDVEVIISQPALNWQALPITIKAFESASYDLTARIADLECVTPNVVENKGLYIQSTGIITAYYDVSNKLNSDLIALKGKSALGERFFIPGQNRFYGYAESRFSFDIVATEDQTLVWITPNKPLAGHPANTEFNISLNRGQTYSCQLANQGLGVNRPIGSFVRSDKPIAITVKDCSLQPGLTETGLSSGSADVAMDQIIPVEHVGTEYILANGSLTKGDYYFVTATEDNTEVYIEGGSAPVATLNKGETYQGAFGVKASDKPAIFINTSKPVYVFQISGNGAEVGGAIIPSIICTGSSYIPFVRPKADAGSGEYSPTKFELTIFIRKGHENELYISSDKKPEMQVDPSAFKDVVGNPEWVAAKREFSITEIANGSSNVIYHKEGEPFHLGIVNGDANTCRFGFFSDFKQFVIRAIASNPNQEYCEGDPITIYSTMHPGAYYYWVGPTGDTIQQGVFDSENETYMYLKEKLSQADGGIYKVGVKGGGNCVSNSFTIEIKVFSNPEVNLGNDTSFCVGSVITLDAGDPGGEKTYSWEPFEQTTQTIVVDSTVGVVEYSVIVESKYPNVSCYASDAIKVNILELPSIAINTNPYPAKGCEPLRVTFENYTDPSSAKCIWKFSDGTIDSTTGGNNLTKTFNVVSETAMEEAYSVELIASTGDGCVTSANIEGITVYKSPKAGFTPPFPPADQLIVQANNSTIKFTPTSAEVPGMNYYWNFGDESADKESNEYSPEHAYEKITAEYTVFFRLSNGFCSDSVQHSVKVINDTLTFTNIITPNGDGINDLFIIDNLISEGGIENYKENTLTIYNRYGKRVFYAEQYKNDWSPTNLPDGTYYYVFTAKNEFKEVYYKGVLTILGSSGK